MAAPRRRRLPAALLLACGLAGQPASAASAAPAGEVDLMADLVARSFLRALFDSDLDALEPLCAPAFRFGGETLTGAAASQRLAEVARRARALGRPRRVVVLPFAAARARFGPPPRRLAAIGLEGSVIGLARLEAGGVLVVVRRIGGRWQAIAVGQ